MVINVWIPQGGRGLAGTLKTFRVLNGERPQWSKALYNQQILS